MAKAMRHPRLITPPAASPVTLVDAKRHCRVEGVEDDALIESYLAAAVARLDGWRGLLGRALEPQTWEMHLDRFPDAEFQIPLGPVVSVVDISYVDATGALQTISPAAYEVDDQVFVGWVVPLADTAWPTTMDVINAVRVRWIAGEGCPEQVRQAIRQTVAYWYDNRDAADVPAGVLKSISHLRRMTV